MAERLEQTGKPEDARVLKEEVKAYRQEEIALLTRDLRLLPETTPVAARAMLLYRLGLMSYLVGEHAEAETRLIAATQLQPESADLHYTLALLYQKLEQRDKALSSVRRLLELQPNNQNFLQLRRELQGGTGTPAGPVAP
jgi:tetratricopeptide (TPR) repeat protein